MQIAQQILFILISLLAIGLFTVKVRQIIRNIRLGRDEALNDHPGQRWNNVLLLAFGQKKMFRNPLVAVLHFFVYAGFIIINTEVVAVLLFGGVHARPRVLISPPCRNASLVRSKATRWRGACAPES